MLANTVGALRRSRGCGRRGEVPLLGRGLVRRRRGALGRRWTGDVDVDERPQTSCDHRHRGRRPLGNDAETTWENLVAGKSGAAEIAQFDASEYPVHFACELKGFEASDFIEKKQARRMDRFAQMIVAAAIQARDTTPGSTSRPRRIASVARSPQGSAVSRRSRTATTAARARPRPGPAVLDPADHPEHGRRLGLDVPGTAVRSSSRCTACAASNMAIGEAADAIRLGQADTMLAGGTEERSITRRDRRVQRHARALAAATTRLKGRPFDAGRDGFVMGEAAGVVVLEELEHARERGAKIYGSSSAMGFRPTPDT